MGNRNKMIICTVGTSISNGCPSQRDFLAKPSKWNDDTKIFEKEIEKRVQDIGSDNFRRISAEINSIDRLDIVEDDKIVLLSSDNAPGKACSLALQRVISDHYGIPNKNIIIRRVEGLQVYDSTELKKIGLKNFISITLEYLDDKSLSYQYDVIINPTGGFKGVLPFLTILGMMYGKKTIYIFEFSEQLIFLPPLPFTFDLNVFDRVRPALEYIEDQVAVNEEVYLSRIKNYTQSEHELFLSFVEPFEDKLTISSLAYCFLTAEKLSRQALILDCVVNKLADDISQPGLALKRLISKVSSPLWRNNHSESWHSSDLIVIKQSRTAERLAGFVKNNTFHVTHAFRTHDEYEAKLTGCSAKNYMNANFVEWTPAGDLGKADVDDIDGLIVERDELILKNVVLVKEKTALAEQRDLLELEKEEVTNRLAECEVKLQNERRNMHDEMKELKSGNIELVSRLELLEKQINGYKNQSFWTKVKNLFERG